MATGLDMAEVAALVGDPGRANMLAALLEGRALTATELAGVAGVTPATASGHLAHMMRGRLLDVVSQGRHRYFRLASADVAHMLESILIVAAGRPDRPRATPRIDPALREARTCYDHLAGRLAVGIADALVEKGAVILTAEAGEVTEAGRAFLDTLGVPVGPHRRTKRLYCRPCLDWSERRPHLAGLLGAGLLERLTALGWVRRGDGRAVTITPRGKIGFAETFGLRDL